MVRIENMNRDELFVWIADLLAGMTAEEQAQLFDLLGRLKAVLPSPQTPVRRRARPGPR